MLKLPKHVHVIGIAGVATSALAIAFHKRGVRVTGSDKGFFPPVSTELEKQGITFYAGWHPEKMVEGGAPDVIIVGTASGSQNPETEYAREHKIPTYSYPEIIGEYFCRDTSIVCAGTWGKTSSSALLSFILDQAGMDPSYMFGGISLSHEASARLTDSKMSVFEGDEYKSSPTDSRAKFFHYKPTHLLLTAVSWDHADLYPTEKDYFGAFEKLIQTLPANGLVVSCADNEKALQTTNTFKGKKVFYSREGSADQTESKYTYGNILQSKDGLSFNINESGQTYEIKSPMIGTYQAENITGCFAMARELGIPADKIISAIGKFKGLKRRLEKRFEGNVTIFDDIAHSPEKASSVLATLRSIYNGKIITIFEPNIGGRERGSAHKYDNAFKDSDVVIIPRLTKLKIAGDKEQPMEGDELAKVISKTHNNTIYLPDDVELVKFLISNTKKSDVIAFLGSHGFRGMIEEVVSKIK